MREAEEELAALREYLRGWRFLPAPETEVQAELAKRLEAGGWGVEREVRLTPEDIIDMRCQRPGRPVIGVEVKVKGSLSDVTRQLFRYCAHPELAGVLLATTLRRHNNMPATMQGKPLGVHVL